MSARAKLTDRQREVLGFVRAHVAEHNYPPTTRELCAHFGFASTNAASDHLRALERKGYLYRVPGEPRALRLLDPDALPCVELGTDREAQARELDARATEHENTARTLRAASARIRGGKHMEVQA